MTFLHHLVIHFINLVAILTFLNGTDFFNWLWAFQRNRFKVFSQVLEVVKSLDHRSLDWNSLLLLIIQISVEPLHLLLEQVEQPRRVMHFVLILLEALVQVLHVKLTVFWFFIGFHDDLFLRGRCLLRWNLLASREASLNVAFPCDWLSGGLTCRKSGHRRRLLTWNFLRLAHSGWICALCIGCLLLLSRAQASGG